MDKTFEFKKCEIGLFNPKIEEYYYNVKMIRDAAKHLDKKQSGRAHTYLSFVYDLANKYLMPIEEKVLDQAIKETWDFIKKYPNSDS